MRSFLIVLLSIVVFGTGCTPSLRPDPGTPTASREECEDIDSSQKTWGTVTTVTLLVAGLVGVAGVLLVESDDGKLATGGVASIGAYGGALSHGQQQRTVRDYRDKKCAAHSASPRD